MDTTHFDALTCDLDTAAPVAAHWPSLSVALLRRVQIARRSAGVSYRAMPPAMKEPVPAWSVRPRAMRRLGSAGISARWRS